VRSVIRFERVSKRFGRDVLLDEVDLEIARGSRWGLIGPGASGKTVMLKLMCGLMRPDAGRIFLDGRELSAMHEDDMGELRQRVGMLFQNYALFDFMNVAENVAFPLVRRGGVAGDELATRVATRLRSVGLAHAGEKRPSELSGGMKKRVGIARATIARPDLVIYDEPTAGLDPVTTSKIYDLLRADHSETGGTVVAVSSDVEALRGFVDRIAMLYKGRLLYDGPSAAIADAQDPVVRQFVRGSMEGPL
jgi:phospholipid/cholesterol/gamma-HCH transport system ATP-binding protein